MSDLSNKLFSKGRRLLKSYSIVKADIKFQHMIK